MIEVSKKEIEAIIEEINKKKVAMIATSAIDDAADKVLNK